MKQNQTSILDQNNQFMAQSQVDISVDKMEEFIQFMSSMSQNQIFMQAMKNHMKNKLSTSQSFSMNNTNQFNQQINFSSQAKLNQEHQKGQYRQDKIPASRKDDNLKSNEIKYNDNRRKGSDVFAKYLIKQQNGIQQKQKQTQIKKINQQMKPKIREVQASLNAKIAWDDQPIASKYTENTNNIDMKENYSHNFDSQNIVRDFDERPIKSMKESDKNEYYKYNQQGTQNNKQKGKQNKMYQQKIEQSGNNIKQKMYQQFEERPIKGINKDFKELVKQRFPEPFLDYSTNNKNQQDYPQEESRPKSFLKRGSRQHLSSAKDRGKPIKAKQENLVKSRMDNNKDTTPRNTKIDNRSISQNRILGKRATDKSTTKAPVKQNLNNSNLEDEISLDKKKPNKYSNKVSSHSKTQKDAKKQINSSPQIKKKAKKNVFQDASESSSKSESSDEKKQAPYFKSTLSKQKRKKVFQMDAELNLNKIEVIQGIFLTKEQLNQILQRYQTQDRKPMNESEKIAQLRKKYTDLCNLLQEERQNIKRQAQKQRQEFQILKNNQLNKIKNERRVMERQIKSASATQIINKQRQELELLKKQMEKQRQDFKKREKNSKIIIQKYKKENEELRYKCQKQFNNIGNENDFIEKEKKVQTNLITKYQTDDNLDDKKTIANKKSTKTKIEQKKFEEQDLRQIKKQVESKQQSKDIKIKYQYVEDNKAKNNKINKGKATDFDNRWKNNDDSENEPQNEQNEIQYGSQQDEDNINQEGELEWTPAMKLNDLTKIPLTIKIVNQKMINALFRYANNIEYKKYLQIINNPNRVVVNTNRNNLENKTIKVYNDKSKQTYFDNGTKKETFENNFSIIHFKNGDIKLKLSDNTTMYYFRQKQVDQITLSNGVNIYRFQNNQVEFHFDQGKYVQIRHPEGTIKILGNQHKMRR